MKKRYLAVLLVVVMAAVMLMATAAAFTTEQKKAADALHEMGLFLGTGDKPDGTPTYELDGNLTRAQSVTLLIRMLGKDREAKNGRFVHPFLDTESWYDGYVGYAYVNKLTNGTGATTFSGPNPVTAQMFATFCLRALGYSDSGENPDFKWDKASVKAAALGIRVNTEGASYKRGDAVLTFWDTLQTKLKGSNQTLAEKLITEGVFTDEDYLRAVDIYNGVAPFVPRPNGGGTSTPTPSESAQPTSSSDPQPSLGPNELPLIIF